jgi:tartrate-resistant acid phosphatase type 5
MRYRQRRWRCIERVEHRHLLAGLPGECNLADVNEDDTVNAADLAMIVANYGGSATPYSGADADGNIIVDLRDALRVQATFGESCLTPAIRFAAFGDYGLDGPDEAAVARLVKSWNPDFVLTLGDNNYGVGGADTIDANIGKHYQEFIGDYAGSYGPGSPTNRFFPSLGNHDWWYAGLEAIAPYVDYFNLPGSQFANSSGNERYYDFVWGPVHFFALNSSQREPDGRTGASLQGAWLRNALANSASPWQIVFFHESPYSSGSDSGSTPDMQWPFREWGADLVLSAHDHNYERLFVDGVTYLVAGTGGAALRAMNPLVPGSVMTYNEAHGSLLITADRAYLRAEFRSVANGETLVDCVAIGETSCPILATPAAKHAAADAILAAYPRHIAVSRVRSLVALRTGRDGETVSRRSLDTVNRLAAPDLDSGARLNADDRNTSRRERMLPRLGLLADELAATIDKSRRT